MSVQHLIQNERGASPLLAFVLLFVITVGVAGGMGYTILYTTSDSTPPAQAGLTVTQYEQAPGTELYTVNVQLINIERADYISVEMDSDTGVFYSSSGDGTDHNGVDGATDDLARVGGTIQVVNLSPGDTVTISGSYRDNVTTLRTYTVK